MLVNILKSDFCFRGVNRVALEARKILVYKEVHEFFETEQNRSRYPIKQKSYAFLAFTLSAISFGTSA